MAGTDEPIYGTGSPIHQSATLFVLGSISVGLGRISFMLRVPQTIFRPRATLCTLGGGSETAPGSVESS